jgi:NitT/TauT family transport system substrate-binding protein
MMTVLIFSGCKAKAPIKVVIMDDLNSASAVHLIDDANNKVTKNEYAFSTIYSAQSAINRIAKGTADIAIVPAYVASATYSKAEGKAVLCALTCDSEFSLVVNGIDIKKISELKDKEIFVSGRSTDVEFMLRYILEKNGVSNDSFKITSVADYAALIEKMNNGTAKIAAVRQPTKALVLKHVQGSKSVLNLAAEWNAVSKDSGIIQGAVVVNEDFMKNNKRRFKTFLKELETAIFDATADKSETAKLCVEYEIAEDIETANAILKNSAIKFISGEEMYKKFRKSITALHVAQMKSIGEKAPGKNFYYGIK